MSVSNNRLVCLYERDGRGRKVFYIMIYFPLTLKPLSLKSQKTRNQHKNKKVMKGSIVVITNGEVLATIKAKKTVISIKIK